MERVALIIGSAIGLGVQTALKLAQSGYRIVVSYRQSKERAEQLQQQIILQGGECQLLQGDITREGDCSRLVREAYAFYQRLDVLILNAGPYISARKSLAEYTTAEWNEIIQGNLSACFFLVKEAIPHMRKQRWGRIITFGFQQAGQATGWYHRAAFAAAKVGVASLTRSLALEESENGITVNMVCPGDIVGDYKEKSIEEVLTEGQWHKQLQQDEAAVAPVGRVGTGEDIARVVDFLCSNKSDFITGSIIEVTGGANVLGKSLSQQD